MVHQSRQDVKNRSVHYTEVGITLYKYVIRSFSVMVNSITKEFALRV
jgi:hypothetical protein